MNRRESLKALGLTAVSTGLLLEACKPGKETTEVPVAKDNKPQPGRQDYEVERDKALKEAKFFNEHEMATIAVLSDIIIPKDEKSKLDMKSRPCIFIDYGEDEFGYRFYDPVHKKLIRSRDVVFMENKDIKDIAKFEESAS